MSKSSPWRSIALVVLLVSTLVACGGGQPEAVDVSGAGSGDGRIFHVARMHCNLLQDVPRERLAPSPDDRVGRKILDVPAIELVRQGDELELLGTFGEWARVRVVRTGTIGWLNKSFILTEKRSEWWHGDTDRAREAAKEIFRDKYMVEGNYPVTHVTIEEAWNQLRFETDPERDFDKTDAKLFVRHWLSFIQKRFPDWDDHFVYLTAYQGGQPYSVYLSDESTEVTIQE